MSAITGPAAGRRLRLLAVWILVLNVAAAVVAIVMNWPAQFGGVGTDAGAEFLTRGTAISAPLLPMILLLLVAFLAGREDGWRWVGVAAAFVTAAVVAIGGIGEMVAEPTDDTPQTVLVLAGVAWLLVATALVVFSTAAALRTSHGTDEPGVR